MKKLLSFLLLFIICSYARGQDLDYSSRLYYTCKIFGYVKYYHSEVSNCRINWDRVLLDYLPMVKLAASDEEFNAVMQFMIEEAGPMEEALTPPPEELPPELSRNLNFDWFYDPALSQGVTKKLEEIKENFRPHENCWYKNNDGTGYGWLVFPHDDPLINSSLNYNFPGEFVRLMIFFKYWNIIKYFNPYNYVLDTPWDSTLKKNIISVAEAQDYREFYRILQKFNASLQDAHVENLTATKEYPLKYVPEILVKYIENEYIVFKSGFPEAEKGDIITAVDGKTPREWEDSLRPFISYGNEAIFRSTISQYMLRGEKGTTVDIELKDKFGNIKQFTKTREHYRYDDWFWEDHPRKDMEFVKWDKFDCNVGYINIGNIEMPESKEMYSELRSTDALIFDLRFGDYGAAWPIADLIYPEEKCFSKILIPDTLYPGAYYWDEETFGKDDNPIPYRGKIIILCNESTQSSLEYVAMILQAMPDAVVVGSQTAGSDGNIMVFRISKDIVTGFTLLGIYYPDGTETQKIGIIPDVCIEPTIEGIRQGRDEVLEKALEIAGCDVNSSAENDEYEENKFRIFPNPAHE